uniref:Uncharacterized protein n=2 Tax=Parascaris univalens TaxID=6257 RepID=A0A915C221_PARUN
MCIVATWVRSIFHCGKISRVYVIDDVYRFMAGERIKKTFESFPSTEGDFPINIFLENSSNRPITSSTPDTDRLTVKILAGVRRIAVKMVAAENSSGSVRFENDAKDQFSYPRRLLHLFAENAKGMRNTQLRILVVFLDDLKNFSPKRTAATTTKGFSKTADSIAMKRDSKGNDAETHVATHSQSSDGHNTHKTTTVDGKQQQSQTSKNSTYNPKERSKRSEKCSRTPRKELHISPPVGHEISYQREKHEVYAETGGNEKNGPTRFALTTNTGTEEHPVTMTTLVRPSED